jgi:hypothetical protein
MRNGEDGVVRVPDQPQRVALENVLISSRGYGELQGETRAHQ